MAGKAVIDALFADFPFVTDGIVDQSILVEMLIVDDDANLSNGTPHFAEIRDAFVDLHGWSDPTDCNTQASVIVAWDGPPGVPVEGVDYAVHCEVDPPNVTLLTTETNLDPVERWTIGRNPSGSLELGTVTASWAPPSNANIIVEVGTDVVNAPCENLNVIDIPAQSLGNWSSTVLTLGNDLKVRAQCYADSSGAGGRISGSVAGTAELIVAEAIGAGSGAQAGNLQVGTLVEAVLEAIPTGFQLSVDTLVRPLVVSSEMNGRIEVGTIHYAPNINGYDGDYGQIHIQGTGVSDGEITVKDAIEGGQIIVDGPYAGTMTVAAMEKVAVLATLPLIQTGDLTGTITITDSTVPLEGTIEIGTVAYGAYVGASGLIDVRSPMGPDAEILIHGDIEKTGKVSILNGMTAGASRVVIDGSVDGTLAVGDGMFKPVVVADVAGIISIGGSLSGRYQHHGSLLQGSQITANSLAAGGMLLIDKLCDGFVIITTDTGKTSLIQIIEGIDKNGGIVINFDNGSFDANGDIYVGPVKWSQMPETTFDGRIEVFGGADGGGDLHGHITAVGCFDGDLAICVAGVVYEKVTIRQGGCANQVDWCCNPQCP